MQTQTISSTAPATSRARRRRYDRSATVAFWVFMSPMLLGLLIFTFIPIVWGFLLSFSRARFSINVGDWVGLQNYASIIADSEFRRAIYTIVVFAIFIVPLTYAVSLGLALLVNQASWGRGFFRTVFFIPTAVSYVVASLVWRMSIFNGLPYGFANLVIDKFGVDPISWIATPSPPWYWLVLVTCRLWLQVGFYMIIFIAGLQEIPQSLYEAAYVDGARQGWVTFRNITLPLLRNTSVAVLTLNIIAAFQAFDEFYNILGGTAASTGNRYLARTPLIYLYDTALGAQDFGRGSAGAFILTALIIVVALIQGRILGFGRAD